uniref:Uncharacterized protein n=1 Tax=Fabrea salina TaxID=342563 RepID=A0A7S3IAV8_9CILI|mmetsp:Transcript_280/g.500  ORF Transcript_280/g.500 Transcript_280/m.500 type:complete len:119 (+) Transcript_280:32-388(+)
MSKQTKLSTAGTFSGITTPFTTNQFGCRMKQFSKFVRPFNSKQLPSTHRLPPKSDRSTTSTSIRSNTPTRGLSISTLAKQPKYSRSLSRNRSDNSVKMPPLVPSSLRYSPKLTQRLNV